MALPAAVMSMPALRTCAFRPRTATAFRQANAVIGVKRPACRSFADDKKSELPKAPAGEDGPNMGQQEHVSEEAAKMAKIQGGEGPDIEGQGTPVQDIMRDEKATRDQAPQVMKDQAKNSNKSSKPSTRTFSTMARRRNALTEQTGSFDALEPSMLPTSKQQARFGGELNNTPRNATSETLPEVAGHKFPLPELPLDPRLVKETRYDPIVEQLTNLMMRDGKKSVAQRYMATILTILRTSKPPTINPARPLLPGAPPAAHLPLNPILYLTVAVDSVAPLLRIRTQRGAAGGGMALQIPVPLGLRQRRRTAFMWILDQASKKKSRTSGKDMFAQKVADELISVVEGKSSIWDRRSAVHKLGTTARTALNYGTKGFRK